MLVKIIPASEFAQQFLKREDFDDGTYVYWRVEKFQFLKLLEGQVLCSDGRRRKIIFNRNTQLYWTGWVRSRGKKITGFVVRSRGVLKFVPYAFGKNSSVLPEWGEIPTMVTARDHCPQYILYLQKTGDQG